jgi:hypothetical protein
MEKNTWQCTPSRSSLAAIRDRRIWLGAGLREWGKRQSKLDRVAQDGCC